MHVDVTGVIEKDVTLYYIAIEDNTGNKRVQVSKDVHKHIMDSLSKGANWIYDSKTKTFSKYSEQLELFDFEEQNITPVTIIDDIK